MRGHVDGEVVLPQKGCIAVDTKKETISCVAAQMLCQVGTCCECARADVALVGALACMAAHMLCQVGTRYECARAQAALEGALASVSAQVCVHVALVFGHISALPAEMLLAKHKHQ